MRFGVLVDPHVEKWQVVQEAERLGFDRAWFGDSQMIWADCYVSMALAATRTSRIQIGTGVTCPGTRIPPVTANAIATINRLAPGRVFLGIGTGHTAMRVMGQPPATPVELRQSIGAIRSLLNGDPAQFTLAGRTRPVQFLHRERGYLNLDDRIPIYVGANGAQALEIAGEFGDGWVTAGGITAEAVAAGLSVVKRAAHLAGRTLPDDFLVCNVISSCVLRPGEKLTDRRVVDQTGSIVTGNLHFCYEVWESAGRSDQHIPPHFADVWAEYVEHVEKIPLAPEARHLRIHEGHATYLLDAERRFVRPLGIRASCVVGDPDEIAWQLEAMGRVGVTDIALVPPADRQLEVFRDFAAQVLPRFH